MIYLYLDFRIRPHNLLPYQSWRRGRPAWDLEHLRLTPNWAQKNCSWMEGSESTRPVESRPRVTTRDPLKISRSERRQIQLPPHFLSGSRGHREHPPKRAFIAVISKHRTFGSSWGWPATDRLLRVLHSLAICTLPSLNICQVNAALGAIWIPSTSPTSPSAFTSVAPGRTTGVRSS